MYKIWGRMYQARQCPRVRQESSKRAPCTHNACAGIALRGLLACAIHPPATAHKQGRRPMGRCRGAAACSPLMPPGKSRPPGAPPRPAKCIWQGHFVSCRPSGQQPNQQLHLHRTAHKASEMFFSPTPLLPIAIVSISQAHCARNTPRAASSALVPHAKFQLSPWRIAYSTCPLQHTMAHRFPRPCNGRHIIT